MEYEYQNMHNRATSKQGTGCQSDPDTKTIHNTCKVS